MALAVTHVLLTIILVDLFRDYFLKKKYRKYFTMHTLFIAGIGGLLPDIDMPLSQLAALFGYAIQHGGVTHTLLFGALFLVPGLILWQRNHRKEAVYMFVLSFGVFFHLFLDLIVNEGYYMLLWPLTAQAFAIESAALLGLNGLQPSIDAVILLIWLYHEEVKHKIKDFI